VDEDLVMDATDPATPPMTGGLSAAILLMLLEDNDASAILQHLDPAEVKALGKAMFDASNATETDVETALEQFVSNNRALSTLAVGAPVRIRDMMHQALGDMRADTILSEIAPQPAASRLEVLKWMDIASIAELVATEHRQVAAILLSSLPPEMAAQAITGLDDATQADLLFRSATLGDVPAEAIRDIEELLARHNGKRAQSPSVRMGGENDVAKIVNNLSRPLAEKLLRSIRKRDRALADAIEEEMFVFDDLANLDAKSLGAVLRMVDADKLALAIKGAGAGLSQQMLSTLSSRAAQTIADEIAEMGPVSRADIEEAQKSVTVIARSMAASGEIMLAGSGADYV
jgi:flagellar motor switch protein FliG